MAIDLLLADEKGHPFIDESLPDDLPIPKPPEPKDEDIVAFPKYHKDPSDLVEQRWAIVAPQGDVGDRLLQVIAPLTAARKEQQEGIEPMVYRVPPGMTIKEADEWWTNTYNHRDTDLRDRPRYLLILGDADLVSWEAQQRFTAGAFAGRLAFKKESDYEAYIHKVLAYERAAQKSGNQKMRAVFHTVRDGTPATSAGHRGLMAPTIDNAESAFLEGKFKAREVVDLGKNNVQSPEDFLRAMANRDPTMLFTISHGLGLSKEASEEERLRFQGAMSFGGKLKITADDIANQPFLPGGAWFFFACFGAGTPSESAYQYWLQSLKEAGISLPQSQIDSVLDSLAQKVPFVAALPQAALANPDGPLAIMGHVDLAWTFSFQDLWSKTYHPSRFEGVFEGIVEHARIGASFADLQRTFNNANLDLTNIFDSEERARRRNLPAPPDAKARAIKKAGLWLLRQDIAAYVMLGDPAAQVATSATAEEVRTAPPEIVTAKTESPVTTADTSAAGTGPDKATLGVTPGETPNPLANIDPARIESAVFAAVGNEAMDAIAKHFGVSRADLDAWVNTFLAGGRAAVRSKQ